jgi:hypothetical protein
VKEVGSQLFENPRTTLEEFCKAAGALDAEKKVMAFEDIEEFLEQLGGLNSETINSILTCFNRA